MSQAAFEGSLVRLVIIDPERDAVEINRWAQDSEYLRLLDSDPAYNWPVKMLREFFENHTSEVHPFIIRTISDNQPIGMVDLSGFSYGANNCWVGIGIGEKEMWGKGFGTDAMKVILRYGFSELNVHRISLNVFEYNQRALRTYEKCGFAIEGCQRQALWRDGAYYDLIFMGILKEEWIRTTTAAN